MLTRHHHPEIRNTCVYLEHNSQTYTIPLYSSRVSAGIPVPADDYIDQTIELNRNLVKHPKSTFLVIASGDSMINAGIRFCRKKTEVWLKLAPSRAWVAII